MIDNDDWFFNPVNADQEVISEMVLNLSRKISGKSDLKHAWDGLFQYHNLKKNHKDKGYTRVKRYSLR